MAPFMDGSMAQFRYTQVVVCVNECSQVCMSVIVGVSTCHNTCGTVHNVLVLERPLCRHVTQCVCVDTCVTIGVGVTLSRVVCVARARSRHVQGVRLS